MKRRWIGSQAAALLVFGTVLSARADMIIYNPKQEADQAKQESLRFLTGMVNDSDRVILANSSLYELDKTTGRVLAKLALNSPTRAVPLRIDGTTYTLTKDGNVTGEKDGKLLWKTKLQDGTVFSDDHYETVASGDYLCISGPKYISCLQRSTGKQVWKLTKPGRIQASAGRLYIASRSAGVIAVELSTGKIVWKEPGSYSDVGPMLIKDGALYISHGSAGTCKLDLATGKTLWKKVDDRYEVTWAPFTFLPSGKVAARDKNGELDVFDCATGKSYKYAPADHPYIPPDHAPLTYTLVDSILVNGNVLYAGGNAGGTGIGGYMSAFEPGTKKQKWLTALDEKSIKIAIPSPSCPPVLFHDLLIFPLDTGVVYALNATTGKVSWKADTGRFWPGSDAGNGPAIYIYGDTVSVYDMNGISCLNAQSGKKLWTFDTKESISAKPLQDGARLCVETYDGTAYAFDVTTGKVIWSFAADGVSKHPTAVAAKESDNVATFSPTAWLNAKKGDNWSREKLLEQFIKQYKSQLDGMKMDRTKILALLGAPQITVESPEPSEHKTHLGDTYQLSEKKASFTVDYDDGVVSGYSSNDAPCYFQLYAGPVKAGANYPSIEKARKAFNLQSLTAVEDLLGPPSKTEVDRAPGFATPLRTSIYWWNLSGAAHQIFSVSTSGMFDQPLAKRRVGSFCIMSASADCPIKN